MFALTSRMAYSKSWLQTSILQGILRLRRLSSDVADLPVDQLKQIFELASCFQAINFIIVLLTTTSEIENQHCIRSKDFSHKYCRHHALLQLCLVISVDQHQKSFETNSNFKIDITLLTNFINMFPKVSKSLHFLNNRMITLQASQQPFICQLCRMDYDRNVATPVIICKNFHVICHNCLQQLASQSDSFRCPYCRMTCGWRRAIQFKFLLDVKDKLVKMIRQQEELRSKILQLQAKNTVLSIETHQLLLRLSMQDVHYRLNESSRWAWGTTQQQLYRNLEKRITQLEGWRIYFKEQANNHASINQNLLRQLKNKNQRIANLQISLQSLQQQYAKKIQSLDIDQKTTIRLIRQQYHQRAKKLQRLAEQVSPWEIKVQLAGLIQPKSKEQSELLQNILGAGVRKKSINDSQL